MWSGVADRDADVSQNGHRPPMRLSLPSSRQDSAARMVPNWCSIHSMAKSVAASKKRRGRPATGREPVTAIRLSSDLRRRLDAWAAQQQGEPGRSEAIRRLVEMALAAASPMPTPQKTAARASRLAGEAIDRLVDKSAPPAEQAQRKRRLIKGPPEFRDIRADLPKAKPR